MAKVFAVSDTELDKTLVVEMHRDQVASGIQPVFSLNGHQLFPTSLKQKKKYKIPTGGFTICKGLLTQPGACSTLHIHSLVWVLCEDLQSKSMTFGIISRPLGKKFRPI